MRVCFLAGSERVNRTGAQNGSQLAKEGCDINTSLSALEKVCRQLATPQTRHVAYRDHPLTQALQVSTLTGTMFQQIVSGLSPIPCEQGLVTGISDILMISLRACLRVLGIPAGQLQDETWLHTAKACCKSCSRHCHKRQRFALHCLKNIGPITLLQPICYGASSCAHAMSMLSASMAACDLCSVCEHWLAVHNSAHEHCKGRW